MTDDCTKLIMTGPLLPPVVCLNHGRVLVIHQQWEAQISLYRVYRDKREPPSQSNSVLVVPGTMVEVSPDEMDAARDRCVFVLDE